MSVAEARQRRGRSARKAERLKHEITYLPEMDRGIPYLDLMTPERVQRVHDASMSILETKGIEFRDDVAIAQWKEAGAKVEGYRVWIDREQIMELIATAPETYRMHARNPDRSVTLGGRKQIFTPAYGAPNVIDLDGERKPSVMAHFHDFAKLSHMASALHMSGGVLVEPLDIAVPKRPLHMISSLIRHSDKPFMGIVTSIDGAHDTLELAKIVFGADFVADNAVSTSLINCNTPLVWDQSMLSVARMYAESNQALLYSPFVLAGANTPASTYGALVQINAEAMAGIAYSQIVRAGSPALYGAWVATVSMRTGSPMSGTPEICHLNMLIAQMARFYKVPCRCSGMCNSSKAVDIQAGFESGRNMYGAVMAGMNFIFSAAGYMETAMSQSYSKFVIDMEQLEMFYKLGSGPDFDELDSALEAISAINPGDHYLGAAHTLANFETAFYLPELMNSDSYEQWDLEGAKDANQRGLEKAGQLLDQYERPPIDPSVDEAISDYVARRERELPDIYL